MENETIESLQREVRGLQEMLYQVLRAVGNPVIVTREAMETIDYSKQISVDHDPERELFVFDLVAVDAENTE